MPARPQAHVAPGQGRQHLPPVPPPGRLSVNAWLAPEWYLRRWWLENVVENRRNEECAGVAAGAHFRVSVQLRTTLSCGAGVSLASSIRNSRPSRETSKLDQ